MSVVRFENVSKIFANGYIGLKDVSFEIEPETLTYIVGESGAGKTTLMRLMIREFHPSEGEVYIEDEPVSKIKEGKVPFLRRKVAVVFQDYKLISERNVYENVALPLEITGFPARKIKDQVMDVLQLVGLADRLEMFPAQLSGGELQRVSIARALVTSPKVLFADEPTGNLDPNTASAIGQLLHKISQLGTTVIVSTHDTNLLTKYPSREIHISKGRLSQDTQKSEPETPSESKSEDVEVKEKDSKPKEKKKDKKK